VSGIDDLLVSSLVTTHLFCGDRGTASIAQNNENAMGGTQTDADIQHKPRLIQGRAFVIVFFATPVIRTVDLTLMPSTKHATTCDLFSTVSLFML